MQNCYLSLAERDWIKLGATESFVFGKLEQSHGWICSRRQYEDQRSTAVGIGKRFGEIERRRFDEVFTEFFRYINRDGGNYLWENTTLTSYTDKNLKIKTILKMTNTMICLRKSTPYREVGSGRQGQPRLAFVVLLGPCIIPESRVLKDAFARQSTLVDTNTQRL